MREKHYTVYVSDDGVEFDDSSSAIIRDTANNVIEQMEIYQNMLTEIQSGCDHLCVTMEAGRGEFLDQYEYFFQVNCMSCHKKMKVGRNDQYWTDRYNNNIGLYEIESGN